MCNSDFTSNGIVVRTIVSNVQTTIAIYEGQVTIAIKTTGMTRTQRNQVTVIDIVDRGCGISKYRRSVGIDGGRTGRRITTGKYGIVNDNTRRIQTVPLCITVLVAQSIQVFNRNVLTCCIVVTIDGDSRQSLGMWLYQHFAVLSQHILGTIHYPFLILFIIFEICRYVCFGAIIHFKVISVIVAFVFVIVAIAVLDTNIELAVLLIGTIHITDIATAEDVAVTLFHTLVRAYLTAIDVYLRLSEDITVGIERTALTQVVVAAATAENVTMYVTFIEFHIGSTGFIDTLQRTDAVVRSAGIDNTTTNGRNLTTTKEGITYMAAIHLDVSDVHTTVVDISTTKDTATIKQTVGTITRPCLVVQFLLIVVFLIGSCT